MNEWLLGENKLTSLPPAPLRGFLTCLLCIHRARVCVCLSVPSASVPTSAASFETPFSVGGKREEEREQFRHQAVPLLNKTARVCILLPSADRTFLKIPQRMLSGPRPPFVVRPPAMIRMPKRDG